MQGTADVDARDLEANRERYTRESVEKLPGSKDLLPPKPLQRLFSFYFTRLYIHVRPERIYVWPDGDATREPQLYDAHMEEVRSGHDEEPDGPTAGTEGGAPVWDERMDELGGRYPDGGALAGGAGRLPVLGARAHLGRPVRAPDPARRRRARVCRSSRALRASTVHDHAPDFSGSATSRSAATSWRRTAAGCSSRTGWSAASSCRRCRSSKLYRMNASKMVRFWRTAKKTRRELSA